MAQLCKHRGAGWLGSPPLNRVGAEPASGGSLPSEVASEPNRSRVTVDQPAAASAEAWLVLLCAHKSLIVSVAECSGLRTGVHVCACTLLWVGGGKSLQHRLGRGGPDVSENELQCERPDLEAQNGLGSERTAPVAPAPPVNLTPTASTERQLDVQEGAELAKSRKRVFPETHPPGPDSARDPYSYCNTPNGSEQAWEGHSPADYRLLSVQVMIRHGDRYPLYTIPKTKRPAIDCTLSASR
ncbi:2-phosphoxylose phosphatase 1 [Takifugu flavidus]|uniref:2-phosphoxylose phosphatase 1 n=1 Tax=Takifugu flavidus TaxID=433684 RepID=A0A5C6PBA2_9TELE|nr:2-phosphoxylose phosphatase 1 [Takifugu flavidus]